MDCYRGLFFLYVVRRFGMILDKLGNFDKNVLVGFLFKYFVGNFVDN